MTEALEVHQAAPQGRDDDVGPVVGLEFGKDGIHIGLITFVLAWRLALALLQCRQ